MNKLNSKLNLAVCFVPFSKGLTMYTSYWGDWEFVRYKHFSVKFYYKTIFDGWSILCTELTVLPMSHNIKNGL